MTVRPTDVPRPAARRPGTRIPAATVAEARRLYEAGDVTQVEIARRLKISQQSVRRLADDGGWRRDAVDRTALVRTIRTRVEAEIAEVALVMGDDSRPADVAERSARTLASLVKTLRELSRLDEEVFSRPGADEETPHDAIADLDGFRAALAERIDRLRAERGQG